MAEVTKEEFYAVSKALNPDMEDQKIESTWQMVLKMRADRDSTHGTDSQRAQNKE